MKPLLTILSKSGKEYKVKWKKYGFGNAIPLIYIESKRNFLGFKFTTKKLVWNKNPRVIPGNGFIDTPYSIVTLIDAESMLELEMIDWFTRAVNYYEVYRECWDKNNVT